MRIEPIEVAGGTGLCVSGPDGPALIIAERDGMLMWTEVPKGYRQSIANSRAGKASAAAKARRAAVIQPPTANGG